MPLFDPIHQIKNGLREIISGNLGVHDHEDFRFDFPPDPALGHLALVCVPFAKKLKANPAEIARRICSLNYPEYIFRAQEAGIFANFFLEPRYLAGRLFEHLSKGGSDFGKNASGAGKKLLIEFSSPNTNKPQHLGHGRNNMLGVSLANLFEQSGYDVVRANLVNDRGIHICKSMLAYQLFGNGATPESTKQKGDHFVGNWYVRYNKELEKNPDLERRAQDMLVKWEQSDAEVCSLWSQMRHWVLDGFNETYQRMGVNFDKFYYESDMYLGGKDEIMAALAKGICTKEDNGAVSIDLEDAGLGKKILLRGDGTAVYITQDIYTTIQKAKEFAPDYSLFVVGNEQENHFRVLFSTLKKFGNDWADKCEHISYGMISLPDGKMKSREGNVVDLDNLFDEVKDLALVQLKERELEKENRRNDEELSETAEQVGQAAVKFMILKSNAKKNLLFDPHESIAFEGMTGPYLQYTHARICSLLRTAGEGSWLKSSLDGNYQWTPEESDMLFQASVLPEKVQQAAEQRNPGLLATYVYEVARLFNRYYYSNQIAKHPDEATKAARMSLSLAVKEVIRQSLQILGICPLEKM